MLTILTSVCYEDSWPVIIEKINLVARFIDVLIVSRVTNYRSVDYSTIKNFVFNVTKDIRMTDIPRRASDYTVYSIYELHENG